MLRCTPFLLFDGNCAEAMTFYHKFLGGELTLTMIGDSPMRSSYRRRSSIELSMRILRAGILRYRRLTGWPSQKLIRYREIPLPFL
jgi:hypothetical protein